MSCLPRETLKQYIIGGPDQLNIDQIEAHLAACQACEQTVIELERSPDTLLSKLRDQGPVASQEKSAGDAASSAIERAVDAIRRLPEADGAARAPFAKLSQIGAYELIRPIGRGGMGVVMLARHLTLQKLVAVKVLPSLGFGKAELVARFQREIRAAGKLNHPAIVNATDAGAEGDTHYLVMEYIDGMDLSRVARPVGTLTTADACELARQAALGLSYAHAQGIVHRDIKPSNLMLDQQGHVKILDFGLAQLSLWNEIACELTTVGQLMGTLDYMAPEQAERSGAVDYRADLYALGATLFRLLTGRPPLTASPNMTVLEKVRLLGSQTAPSISVFRDDCPAALVTLIHQLLSHHPQERPASAAHVAEALHPFCDGHAVAELAQRARDAEPTHADELQHWMTPQLSPGPSKLAHSDSTTEQGSKRSRSRRWLGGIATASALLLLVALAAAVVVLKLETDKGLLVIESEVPDVRVQVKKDGQSVDDIAVRTGTQVTRLYADKYEITIDTPSDGVSASRNQVVIKRGEAVVVKLQRTQSKEPAPSEAVTGNTANVELANAGLSQQNKLPLRDLMESLRASSDESTEILLLSEIPTSPADDAARAEAVKGLVAWMQNRLPAIHNSDIHAYLLHALRHLLPDVTAFDNVMAGLLRDPNPRVQTRIYRLLSEVDWQPYKLVPETVASQLRGDLPLASDAAESAAHFLMLLAHSNPHKELAVKTLRESKLIPARFWISQAQLPAPTLAATRSLAANTILADMRSSTDECLLAYSFLDSEVPTAALDWIDPRLDLLRDNRDRMLAFYQREGHWPIHNIDKVYWNNPNSDTLGNIGLNEFDLLCKLISRRKLSEKHREKLLEIRNQIPGGPMLLKQGQGQGNDIVVVDRDTWSDASQQHCILNLFAVAIDRLLAREIDANDPQMAVNKSSAPPATKSPENLSPAVMRALKSPIYSGQDLNHWLTTLINDRSTETQLQALLAVNALVTDQDREVQDFVGTHLMNVLRNALGRVGPRGIDRENVLRLGSQMTWGGRQLMLAGQLVSVLARIQDTQSLLDSLMTEASQSLHRQATLARLFTDMEELLQPAKKRVLEMPPEKVTDPAVARLWFLFLLDAALLEPEQAMITDLQAAVRWYEKTAATKVDIITARLWKIDAHDNNARAIEEELAFVAKQILLDESSSVEAIAIAAGRLASTTNVVDSYRAELEPALKKRLSQLAADPRRLLTPLTSMGLWTKLQPLELHENHPGTGLVISFNLHDDRAAGRNTRSALATLTTPGSTMNVPVRVIDSEVLTLLALVKRLNLVAECSQELLQLLHQIAPLVDEASWKCLSQERWPFASRLSSKQSDETTDAQLQQQAVAALLLATLNTMTEPPYLVAAGPEAWSTVWPSKLRTAVQAKQYCVNGFARFDSDGDGKLTRSEADLSKFPAEWNANGDNEITLEEINRLWQEIAAQSAPGKN